MPIYEYACGACGHRMEALQRMSDDPLTDCPKCHKKLLKKLISAAAFRLKGGGWYETDFKSGAKKNLANSDSSTADSKPKKSADSGSETKKKKSESTGSESKTKKTETKSSSQSGAKKKSSSKD